MVELVFVFVILSILTLIIVPKIRGAKVKAQRATVVTTLRNLMTTQEAYWSQYDNYASSVTDAGFETLPGITVNIIVSTPSGWSAKAVEDVFNTECAVYYGTAAPLAPATQPHVIGCQ